MKSSTSSRTRFDEGLRECLSVGNENLPPMTSSSTKAEPIQEPEPFSTMIPYVPSMTYESPTKSMSQPYSPISGPSTPAYSFMPMERTYSTPAIFGLTPPESNMGEYPPNLKYEYIGSSPYPEPPSATAESPERKYATDLQYTRHLAMPMETTDPRCLSNVTLVDGIPNSLELPPVPLYVETPYGFTSMGWSGDGSGPQFVEQGSTFHGAALQQIPLPNHQQRRLRVDDVQQKSMALQKVQQSRVRRRTEQTHEPQRAMPLNVGGRYKCQHPNCVGKRGFKRQEHLKRHENTVHYLIKGCDCPFCPSRDFNRDDNFRNHVKLHTVEGGTGRTRHHPGAQAYLDVLNSAVKSRSVGGRRRAPRGTKAATTTQQPSPDDIYALPQKVQTGQIRI